MAAPSLVQLGYGGGLSWLPLPPVVAVWVWQLGRVRSCYQLMQAVQHAICQRFSGFQLAPRPTTCQGHYSATHTVCEYKLTTSLSPWGEAKSVSMFLQPIGYLLDTGPIPILHVHGGVHPNSYLHEFMWVAPPSACRSYADITIHTVQIWTTKAHHKLRVRPFIFEICLRQEMHRRLHFRAIIEKA